MLCEKGLRDPGDGSDALLRNYAIELLKQDFRPIAIVRNRRTLYGTQQFLDHAIIFENEAFRSAIRTQSNVWSERTLSKLLDVDCPGEVVIAGLGVRFWVSEVGCAEKVRGIIVLDYCVPENVDRWNEGKIPITKTTTTSDLISFTPEIAEESVQITEELGSTEDQRNEADSDDDYPFPWPRHWVPKQYPHRFVNWSIPPLTPPGRQQRPFSTAGTRASSPSSEASAITDSKAAKQYVLSTNMPNREAAAEYFKRIGRGGGWEVGAGEGAETEDEWKMERRKQEEGRPSLDWTQPDFKSLPQYSAKHYGHLRAIDWSKTSLGRPDTWDASLSTIMNTIMTCSYPTALYWGPEYTIVYNEHFVAIAQNRNPYILGKTFAAGWPELAGYFIPILDKAYYHGEATVKQEELLHIVGRVPEVDEEESYFNFIMCPFIGKDGKPVGVMEQAFEVTREVISNRRLGFLRYLGETLVRVDFNVTGEFLSKVFQAFETTPDVTVWNDTPFMGLYALDDLVTGKCSLVGSIGLPRRLAPESCDLFSHSSAEKPYNIFVQAMKEGMETGETVLIKFDIEVAKDIETRSRGKLCRYAVLIPIQAGKGLMRGFLILGINPQRPFDDDYRFWVGLLKTELSSTAGREELLKAEIRKGIDAEIQRTERARVEEVQRMLDTRTKELRESELLFTKTAETIPVGLALIDINGDLIYTNTAYHTLTTLPREADNPRNLTWRDIVYSEDRERVYRVFDDAVSAATPAQWEARTGLDHPERGWTYWVSCNMVVQTNEQTGELTGYMLTLSDITQIKLAEEYQRQLSVQAVEKRRQQENFIDIFSHELRNPFSATLQCADGILAAVTEYQLKGGDLDVDDIADASSTILVCVQHQMRIINDVLTLSKLDSMLLSVVPVDVQIHESILTTLKIFQSELQVKGIKATFIIGDSYERLNLDWLKCDPSRFNQILVNLLTNAIKFTSLQTGRCEITVTLDAYLERPKKNGDVIYTSSKPDDEESNSDGGLENDNSKIQGEEWGSGEPVYVHVEVQDTGIGISEHWQKKLFNRFEQVPKTHVTYGGSGLGLFICRKLCRLQGGRIGVCSEEGKGSKFSFYITARRTNRPQGAPISGRPNKVQVISDNSAHGSPSTAGLPRSGTGNKSSIPAQTAGSFHTTSGIPDHIIATFIPEHITTPRLAAVRKVQSAMAAQPLSAATVENTAHSSSEPAPQPEFTPHPSTSSAMQSTLKAFKPFRSPSIQPQPQSSRAVYKVLIVEDNLINQEVLRRQLRKEGCIAHVANNGQEGLEFIERSAFAEEGGTEVDIVLMDMEMPVMDGNTATRMIRRMEVDGRLRRHVPILGISANARSEQVAEMIKAGMDDAISKPFRIMDLVAKFDQLVNVSGGSYIPKKPKDKGFPPPQTDVNRTPSQNVPLELSSLASILNANHHKTPLSHEIVPPSCAMSPIVPLPSSTLDRTVIGGSSSPNIAEVFSPNVLPSPIKEWYPHPSEPATRLCSPAISPELALHESRQHSPFMRAESVPLPVNAQNFTI